MSRIRGVIFDMDGVLIDAKEWHYDALNQALALFGLTITRAEHEGEFDGLPTREKLDRLTARYGLPASLHTFINEMKQIYTLQLINQNCWPVYEHQLALSRLKQHGYRLAVASNSVRGSIDNMLSRAKLLDYLQFTLSNEDVSRGKPDPEIYLKAQLCLGLKPQECVIVEDNPHGIAAARASGAHVMEVAGPSEVTWNRLRNFIAKCEEAA
ncbi:Phosphorylated carbohydrates phosphatase TM_1254 [Cedecea davisae]|uniref:HAD hydrolase, family IA, variant 3 n=1 Tax=Cedecea davisae DSM 4568 TaxID=566551 RepID=S3JXJ6_9ENTR|nr:HAD family phosphatase [Cedecea davisae]EPF17739.1 HAD hydrolase, family IA, variant 3 [Cedecea davisae DSM 4568]SUX28038.1 Phosphorylated carbohydrates phosphatase TM_1254 [Cedecea davisae]